MSLPLTADDFFAGFFAALRLRGRTALSIRGDHFDRAVGEAFADLLEHRDRFDVDVRFQVRPHPIHGDSMTVRDGITTAAQDDIISLDNPEYQDIRLTIGAEDAEAILSDLALPRELFLEAADRFEAALCVPMGDVGGRTGHR